MLNKKEWRLLKIMVKCKLWVPFEQMRLIDFRARWGTRWLLKRMKKNQTVDDLHHAPCCPANHYHYGRLVLEGCTCGAQLFAHYEEEERKALGGEK